MSNLGAPTPVIVVLTLAIVGLAIGISLLYSTKDGSPFDITIEVIDYASEKVYCRFTGVESYNLDYDRNIITISSPYYKGEISISMRSLRSLETADKSKYVIYIDCTEFSSQNSGSSNAKPNLKAVYTKTRREDEGTRNQ